MNVGPGRLTSLDRDISPSTLPVGILYLVPPDRATASLVASAIMSAQETVCGHARSRAVLIWSISSYSLTVPFAPASFSA